MAQTLLPENFPEINVKEATVTSAEAAAGANSIVVENAQNAAPNDFIYIGTPGSEKVEKAKVASVTGQTITLVGALSFKHERFSLVTVVRGDQIQVYTAANVDGSIPADADFSAHDSPVDIDADDVATIITDEDGTTDLWYKYVYYDSDASQEVTTLNASVADRGGDYGAYATIEDILIEAGLDRNPYIKKTYVALKRFGVQSEINSKLNTSYTVPFTEPIPGIIEHITILMTAGYVLMREYGPTASGTSKDGEAKLQQGRDLLGKAAGGTIDIVDESGESLTSKNAISGWPNSSTATAEGSRGGSKRAFRMSDRF